MSDKEKTMVDVADKAVDKLANGSEKLFEGLATGIKEIGDIVGKAAPHVWEVLVRQVIMEGIVHLIIAIVLSIFVYKASKWAWANSRHFNNEDLTLISGLIIVASLILSGVSLYNLIEGVKKVGNPQYYAAVDMIDKVKELKNGNSNTSR